MQNRKVISLILDADASRAEDLIDQLRPLGHASRVMEDTDVKATIDKHGRVDALYVSSSYHIGSTGIVEFCKQFLEYYPRIPLYVTVDPTDRSGEVSSNLLGQLMRIGVRDIQKVPLSSKFLSKLGGDRSTPQSRVYLQTQQEPSRKPQLDILSKPAERRVSPDRNARIIFVASPAGGDGKSTVAAQIAMYWAEKKDDVLLIDANHTGILAQKISKAKPNYTILDFEKGGAHLDKAVLRSRLLHHDHTELEVLAAPQNHNPVSSSMLRNALQAYRSLFRNIIVELPPGLTNLYDVSKEFEGEYIVVTLPDGDRLERMVSFVTAMKEDGDLRAFDENVHFLLNGFTSQKQQQDVRIGLRHVVERSRISYLPFYEGFDFPDAPPLFADKESRYSKSLKKFMSGLHGAGSVHQKDQEIDEPDFEEPDEEEFEEPADPAWKRWLMNVPIIGALLRRGR